MESNSAEPASTMDTPIDPITREPMAPVDPVPSPEEALKPADRLEILLFQRDPDLKNEEVGARAILVKSTRRDVAALELFFESTKPEAAAVCTALSKLRNTICRTGPVGWDV